MTSSPDPLDRPLSGRVVAAVAAFRNEDPLSLELLATAIDPDALDSLFTSQATGHLRFHWAGCEVTVDSTGAIDVTAGGTTGATTEASTDGVAARD